MKVFIKIIFIVGVLSCALTVNGQTPTRLQLPAIFSDHMVFQQQSHVPVWGWAGAGLTVKLVGSWMPNDTVSVKANNYGYWKAELPTIRYGGPYTLQIFSHDMRDRIELKDIMLGEVWLCSGQSNMEWSPDNGIQNRQQEIEAANHPNIRFFSLNKQGSRYLQEDCLAQWEQCTPETMRKRSAVAYLFGKKLQAALDVPVGLIVSAWGGTSAEVWVPRDTIMNNEKIAGNLVTRTSPWWPVEPGTLYNSMIHPLMPYDIAGVIWYQGESNRDKPSSYCLLMEKLIQSWRKGFGKDFPFYLVQIAPFNYDAVNNGPALIREAQEQVTHNVDNTGLVVINDKGDPTNIHPKWKQEVGARLANMALGKHYGLLKEGYESPFLEGMTVRNGKAILTFSNAEKGLVCTDKEVKGMVIAGEDGRFVEAKTRIKGNQITVFSPQVKNPTAVRYCFDNATIGNLFNREGLPVAPFRTDAK